MSQYRAMRIVFLLLVLVIRLDFVSALISTRVLPKLFRPCSSICTNQKLNQHDQDLIKEKLAGWLKLKEAGALSQKTLYEEDVEELDQLLLSPKLAKATISQDEPPAAELQPADVPNKRTRAHYLLERRVVEICTTYTETRDSTTYAQGLLSVLTDLRDRGTADDLALADTVVMKIAQIKQAAAKHRGSIKQLPQAGIRASASTVSSHSREESTGTNTQDVLSRKQIAAYRAYTQLADRWEVPAAHRNAVLLQHTLALYQYGAVSAAEHCQHDLVQSGRVPAAAFLPGQVCAALHEQHNTNPPESSVDAAELLASFQQRIASYSIQDVNLVLRTLARYHQAESLFTLLECARAASVVPNSESTEILTNAFVRTVSKGYKALSMASLPAADAHTPEVIFIGRSNVGKSSLVNFLLNRKALASTSATPGHTTQFHFYTINEPTAPAPALSSSTSQPARGNRSLPNSPPAGATGKNRRAEPSTRTANTAPVQQVQRSAGQRQEAMTRSWPMLRFVDVPGMGYAESPESAAATEEQGSASGDGSSSASVSSDRPDAGAVGAAGVEDTGPRDRSRTWRGLLDRYLCVRDPLRVVFHLIDARHGVTRVDREVLDMVRRAQDERTEQDRRPLQYTVLLTKTDKIPDSEIAARALQVTQDVQAHLDSVVRVIQTSVVDKIGADSVWKIITAA